MSTSSLVRVNQKLAHAKFLIEHALSLENELSELQSSSFIEAICFHLFCAYQHYLREIAETYHLKISSDKLDEQHLIGMFEAKDKYPVEAQELLKLKKDSASWLFHLHKTYENYWRQAATSLKDHPASSLPNDNSSLIQLVNLDQPIESSLPSLQTLKDWQESFRSLVIRQRQTSAEF